ncbi:bacteriocin [Burkholderia sp. BE12]|uniref:bacteriocin n=1 Tax=Burkholderia sp. BE12 TaxID=2082394 RepID=UPI000CF56463|nr:bacteriocin [Burkholderia sp. BE12]
MRELTINELDLVSGATWAGDIAMSSATGWAGAVAGFGIGGVIGFGMGVAASAGFSARGGTFGREPAGTDYSGCSHH